MMTTCSYAFTSHGRRPATSSLPPPPSIPLQSKVKAFHHPTRTSTSTTLLMASSSGKEELKRGFFARFASGRTTSTSTDKNDDGYKILVKPRPVVTMDPKTGQLRQQATPQQKQKDDENQKKWKSFKLGVFNAYDSVSSLVGGVGNRRRNKSSSKNNVMEGYSDRIATSATMLASSETPGQRLMRQYEQQSTATTTTRRHNRILQKKT
mmetsp:Transcript_33834/g.50169  ORF Transcript_33834/g.50169 Transcript_33834/m.50169 type:complete len:208 (-) Transcript_33834:3469-4092(-)